MADGKTTRRKLILDVDTGTDDAVAIMLAALHPALDLVACTVVNGNVAVEYGTDNTLRVLDHIGRSDIPVHQGLARPLVRAGFPDTAIDRRPRRKNSMAARFPCPRRKAPRPRQAPSSS